MFIDRCLQTKDSRNYLVNLKSSQKNSARLTGEGVCLQ
jgi:hypothetical protein